MKAVSILALAAGVRAATAPLCKACEQSECLDSIIKEECGEYLVIVETPATSTVIETVLSTVVPTETKFVSVSTTALSNATATVHVSASQTVDFTVTLTESETETLTRILTRLTTTSTTETETKTVTDGQPLVTGTRIGGGFQLARRHQHVVDRFGYDVPEDAMCDDIYEYSSACDCVGFTPSTSTAAAPSTTETVTETVTPSTAFVTETIATLSFSRNITTIPVTATATTVTISQAVDTVTETTVVATTTTTTVTTATTTMTRTITTTVTETPTQPTQAASQPTYVGRLVDRNSGNRARDFSTRDGIHNGFTFQISSTATPAVFVFTPDGRVTLNQDPATWVPYNMYHFSNLQAYSYIQLTSEYTAQLGGMIPLKCLVKDIHGSFNCYNGADGSEGEAYACGSSVAIVWGGRTATFESTCRSPITKLSLGVEVISSYFTFGA